MGIAAILVIMSQSVFPHQLRPGDIVTDGQGEWEVIGFPSAYNQGKSHQVRVQKPGDPSIKSINFYSAHERVEVKRQRPGGEAAATKHAHPRRAARPRWRRQPRLSPHAAVRSRR